jgi:hypothetical protein
LRTHRTPNAFTLGVALRVVAVGLVAVIASFGQVGVAEATASVPPETYAAAICGAVATLHSNTAAAEASVKAASQAYKDAPSQATATELRDVFDAYLQQGRTFIGDALTAFQKAGVPAGKNGVRFAQALKKNVQTVVAGLDPLIKQASAIKVTSSAAFSTSFRDVAARATAVQNASTKRARQDAAFNGVPKSLHRIVSYMRGEGQTCPAR